jgi:hypothetical protein
MRYLLIIALVFVCPLAAQAAPTSPCLRYPKGKVPVTHVLPLCEDKPAEIAYPIVQGIRIRAIAKTLGTNVPEDWHFIVVSETQWAAMVKENGLHLGEAQSAISSLTGHFTFIREGYAVRATDYLLRQSLAHEMGHYQCGCTDENKANFYRDKILANSDPR